MLNLLHYLRLANKRIRMSPVKAAELINIRNELQAMTESLSKPVPFERGEG